MYILRSAAKQVIALARLKSHFQKTDNNINPIGITINIKPSGQIPAIHKQEIVTLNPNYNWIINRSINDEFTNGRTEESKRLQKS